MTTLGHDPCPTYPSGRGVWRLVRAIPAGSWTAGVGASGRLVGHTSRSLITVETYLGQPAATEDVTSPAAYLAAVARVDPAAVGGPGPGRRGGAWGTTRQRPCGTLVDRGCWHWSSGPDDPLISTSLAVCGCGSICPPGRSSWWCTGWTSLAAAGLPARTTATVCCRGARSRPRPPPCSGRKRSRGAVRA